MGVTALQNTSKSSTMKIFILCTVLVSSTMGMMMGNEMMVKKWSKFKAMESCYGEDLMKTHMLKMKRAIAKCTKAEMPELDLPMFSSPYRAIQALLNGARDTEQKNVAKFQEVMKSIQGNGQYSTGGGNTYVPIPVQQKTEPATADPIEEIMRKMFLRKVMNKFFDKKDDSDEDDDFFGIDDDEKFAELLFFNKNKRQLGRRKRQSDLYELGDRLSEKLMEQKEEMKAKMGNWSCAMKELKIVDDNLELDLENMLDDIKSMNIRDKWLEDKTIEDVRTCYAVAQSLPVRFFAEFPMPEQWVKIKK